MFQSTLQHQLKNNMLKLITVGKMKNRALAEICADFTDRLKRFGGLEIVELKDSTPEKEGERIIESLKNFKGRVYVMSEEGRTFSSKEFSQKLEQDELIGGSAFVIGSAYGLSEATKKRADILMSMSPMTFTHEFARAILIEQIYRAKTITAKTGYHH